VRGGWAVATGAGAGAGVSWGRLLLLWLWLWLNWLYCRVGLQSICPGPEPSSLTAWHTRCFVSRSGLATGRCTDYPPRAPSLLDLALQLPGGAVLQ